MEDRIPTPGQAGRMMITPEDGSAPFYAKLTMADNPEEEGTPLNKSTLLQDATCQILGIPETSVPNDAFTKLALGIGKYGYALQVQAPDGTPIPGAEITGASARDGSAAVTDDNGLAVVVSTAQSIQITVSSTKYIDLEPSVEVSIESTGILTNSVITMPYVDGAVRVETSAVYEHTAAVSSIDVASVGAGGGGGGPGNYLHTSNYDYYSGGTGGGGGHVANKMGVTPSADHKITVVVGAGGTGGASLRDPETESDGEDGADGCTTTVTIGDVVITAQGGPGGSGGKESGTNSPTTGGNGNGSAGEGDSGGKLSPGTDGSEFPFNDPSMFHPGGGGGGGRGGQDSSGLITASGPLGGQGNGGTGQGHGDNANYDAKPGGPSGGGGGGGLRARGILIGGATGGDGLVFCIFHHGGAQ